MVQKAVNTAHQLFYGGRVLEAARATPKFETVFGEKAPETATGMQSGSLSAYMVFLPVSVTSTASLHVHAHRADPAWPDRVPIFH